ncbi:MAG: EAL domain-containing protein [Gallionella sp.]|nr:EAL domain-containing protein [Gallionella sp.]MDD4946006.1 EAL domain-containing protein [Gallionella sp.]MDD5613090.1 EAL domain-containing protein [Gallionella sp.]
MNSKDNLTGLLDRFGCLQAAEKLLTTSLHNKTSFAVVWLDLDRFKKINDSFGHTGGDAVIRNLAERLQRVVGRSVIARMSSDEFVFLLPECDRPHAESFSRLLAETVQELIPIGNMTLCPTASIGIAIHETGETSLDVLERADRAMGAAKSKGGNCIVCSGDEPTPGRLGISLAREELLIESNLHVALETGGLCLNYQPLVRADGSIEAVEALMRCSVKGENLPPAKFIPVAEKTGLVVRLGEWSLLQGALQAQMLQNQGYQIKVAINVSRAQLTSPKFTQALNAALICSNVNPALLELELTESLFMDISNTVQMNLRNAIATGVTLSIDDFGTGYSCLANLKDIPARKLKLDRAFVTVLPEDARALAVVRAMVQLGHELDMTVVAEGCERQEENDLLLEAGVDAIQGYFYAKPMPEQELVQWLQSWSTK